MVLSLTQTSYSSDSNTYWTWLNPTPYSGYVRDIIWDGNKFVALEGHGIATSKNGDKWKRYHVNGGMLGDMLSIASNGEIYVAVGVASNNSSFYDHDLSPTIYVSIDGDLWSKILLFDDFKKVIWNGKIFVVIGNNNAILTSHDGFTWEKHDSGMNGYISDIVWSKEKNIFVAVGFDGVILSKDGITWQRPHPIPSIEHMVSITWANGKFVLANINGTTLTSSDGVNWSANLKRTDIRFNSIAGNKSGYVAVSDQGEFEYIFYSPDGIQWAKQKLKASARLVHVMATKGRFIATGWGGTILSSNDGKTWTRIGSKDVFGNRLLLDIIHADDQYILLSEDTISISKDAINWETHIAPQGKGIGYSSIAYSKELATYVLGSGFGSISTSIDGRLWERAVDDNMGDINQVVWANHKFVITATGGIFVSPDGYKWTKSVIPNQPPNSIAYSEKEKRFVGVGSNGIVVTSPDAVHWHFVKSFTNETLSNVAWAKNRFIIVGRNTIIESAGPQSWKILKAPVDFPYGTYSSSVWAGDRFVIVGQQTLTSKDGNKWTPEKYQITDYLSKIIWDGTHLICVGEHAAIVRRFGKNIIGL